MENSARCWHWRHYIKRVLRSAKIGKTYVDWTSCGESTLDVNFSPLQDFGTQTMETLSNCTLPWIDLVETDKESNAISVVILVCLLLTLLFDTFLIAIILLHDDLRRKARISWCNLKNGIFFYFRGSTFSWSRSASATWPLPSISLFFSNQVQFSVQEYDFHFSSGINKGRYADFVNENHSTCKWSKVLGTFLLTAPWYNFLGKNDLECLSKKLRQFWKLFAEHLFPYLDVF